MVAGGHYVALGPFESDADEQVDLTHLASGGFLFTWLSGGNLQGYLIDASGSAVGSVFYLNEAGSAPRFHPFRCRVAVRRICRIVGG